MNLYVWPEYTANILGDRGYIHFLYPFAVAESIDQAKREILEFAATQYLMPVVSGLQSFLDNEPVKIRALPVAAIVDVKKEML